MTLLEVGHDVLANFLATVRELAVSRKMPVSCASHIHLCA